MADFITPQYAFPNISFSETVVGPSPITRPWRDRIGVAAAFRRGPQGPTVIEDRQSFVYLYGEDTSPGSLFVQQAMSQGATRFVVSRAVPAPSPASTSLVFSNTNPALPPIVAMEGPVEDTANHTTGLSLTLSYIGSPFVVKQAASEITSQNVAEIEHETFRGRALMRYYVIDYSLGSLGSQLISSATSSIKFLDGEGTTQVVLIDKTQANVDDFLANLKPGTVLRPSATPSSKAVKTIKVLSTAFDNSPTHYGVVGRVETVPNTSGKVAVEVTQADINAAGVGGVVLFRATGLNFTPAAGDSFKFVGSSTVYTIQDVEPSTPAVEGNFDITLAVGITTPVREDTVIQFEITVPAPSLTPAQSTTTFQVSTPLSSAYVIGYRLESVDGGDLSETTSPNDLYLSRKFDLPSNPAIKFDGYFMLSDTLGATFVQMPYYSITDKNAILSGDAYALTVKSLGINLMFTPEGGGTSSLIGLRLGAEWFVPFARSSITVGGASSSTDAFPRRKPVSDILSELEAAIYADPIISSMISEVRLAIDIPPYSITLTTAETGLGANRVRWKLDRMVRGTAAQAADLLLNGSATEHYGVLKAFAGGNNGPTLAFRDFYSVTGEPLLRIIAQSPGTYGNKLRVDIVPDTNGRFQVTVVDEDSRQFLANEYSETFVLDNHSVDRQSGVYPDTLNSKLVRAYFIPVLESQFTGAEVEPRLMRLLPLRLASPFEVYNPGFSSGPNSIANQGAQFLKSIYLRGGTDLPPNVINISDIQIKAQLDAVKRLESSNICVLGVPGLTYGDSKAQPVFDEARRQCERATALNGLRIAIFDAPPRMGARQAYSLASQIDSPRVVLLSGHQTFRGQQNAGFNAVPSSGTYAGALVVRPPHISPPSTYGGFSPRNVVSVDTDGTPPFLDTLTRGRAEALFYDGSLELYKFLNGLTTSSNDKDRYVSVRRIMDQIISDLYNYLQWVRSEPNTRSLQKRVAAACDAYLNAKMTDDYLVRIAPTICGPENNTNSDMIRGILNIRIRVTPVFPADYILVSLIRDLTEDFSLNTASS